MSMPEFLTLFFWLPALIILSGFRCCLTASRRFTSLYIRFIDRLQRSGYGSLPKYVAILMLSLSVNQNANTQTTGTVYTDSNYVDTKSMSSADSIVKISEQNNEPGYDDQNDGYADTAVKHIYDTSQYFFSWKNYNDHSFTTSKIAGRNLIDSEVNALKNEDDFWYIPAIEKLETRLRNDPEFRDSLLNARKRELIDEREKGLLYQPWFNTLIWVVIIGVFVVAVIYFLIQNKINLFSKEAEAFSETAGNEEHEDIFILPYTKLIQNAEKEKNYRVSVRLMFLQVLKTLSDTNNIHYQPDYTNLHYLQQLHQSKYYNEFFKVMRSYEYVWYGKFNISPEQYKTIKNDFLKLQNKII